MTGKGATAEIGRFGSRSCRLGAQVKNLSTVIRY